MPFFKSVLLTIQIMQQRIGQFVFHKGVLNCFAPDVLSRKRGWLTASVFEYI
jgi:hypothetical protein